MNPEDVRMLISELRDLHHQVDILQGDVKAYYTGALVILSALTFVGLGGLLGLWRTIGDRVDKEVGKHSNEAKTVLDRVKTEWTTISSNLASSFLIKTGSRPLTFKNTNYVKYTEVFPKPFPTVPVVVLSESIAGEWCYAKVDEIHPDRFIIAIRTLSGAAINETRNIQWFAICPRPALEPPAGHVEQQQPA